MSTRVAACRVCGCTDEHACPGGCGWIQSGLCSSCLGAVRMAACRDCGVKPGNMWCRRPSGHSGPMVAFHRARIDAAAAARELRAKADRLEEAIGITERAANAMALRDAAQ